MVQSKLVCLKLLTFRLLSDECLFGSGSCGQYSSFYPNSTVLFMDYAIIVVVLCPVFPNYWLQNRTHKSQVYSWNVWISNFSKWETGLKEMVRFIILPLLKTNCNGSLATYLKKISLQLHTHTKKHTSYKLWWKEKRKNKKNQYSSLLFPYKIGWEHTRWIFRKKTQVILRTILDSPCFLLFVVKKQNHNLLKAQIVKGSNFHTVNSTLD